MPINKKVKVIGLTGMSGAGKSTACRIFENSGFDNINCDLICREIVEKGKPCLKEIAEHFGNDVLTQSGELNRPNMGRLIFSDSEKRNLLNGIMYPYVSYIVIKRILYAKNKYVIIDAPTLFESGIDDICDIIVSIVADKEILIKRVTKRDNIDERSAKQRLSSQHCPEYYAERSDHVINNNRTNDDFIKEIMNVIDRIKES